MGTRNLRRPTRTSPEARADLVAQLERRTEELERANQALRASEEKYRRLVDNLKEGIWEVDKDACTTFVNPSMAAMLGYSPEEMIGKHLFEFTDEAGVKAAKRYLLRRKQGIREQHDFEFARKDGTRLYVSLEAGPLLDEQGRYVGALAGVMDITARRLAEEERERLLERQQRYSALLRKAGSRLEARVARRTAELAEANRSLQQEITEHRRVQDQLREERRRLFSLLNMLPGFVLLHGGDHSVSFANHRFLDIFGDPSGKPCYAVLRGRDRPCERCYPEEVLRTGEPREWEWTSIHGRDYHVWGYPFHDSDGTRMVLELGIDVTEARQLAREVLKISGEERHRIGRDLHDVVGQNLAGVSFLSNVLSRRLEASESPESAQAREITKLVGETIAQTRAISRGLCPVAHLDTGLRGALAEMAADTERVFGVPCEFRCTLPATVLDRGAATNLYLIAQEAVSNATRHASPSHVGMTLGRAGDDIMLSVCDDGVGMPDHADRGRGMGLRIMKYRADVIGASLDIGPGDSGGTCVRCALPRHKAEGGA